MKKIIYKLITASVIFVFFVNQIFIGSLYALKHSEDSLAINSFGDDIQTQNDELFKDEVARIGRAIAILGQRGGILAEVRSAVSDETGQDVVIDIIIGFAIGKIDSEEAAREGITRALKGKRDNTTIDRWLNVAKASLNTGPASGATAVASVEKPVPEQSFDELLGTLLSSSRRGRMEPAEKIVKFYRKQGTDFYTRILKDWRSKEAGEVGAALDVAHIVAETDDAIDGTLLAPLLEILSSDIDSDAGLGDKAAGVLSQVEPIVRGELNALVQKYGLKHTIITALTYTEDESLVPALLAGLTDADEMTRWDIVQRLVRLEAKESLGLMSDLFDIFAARYKSSTDGLDEDLVLNFLSTFIQLTKVMTRLANIVRDADAQTEDRFMHSLRPVIDIVAATGNKNLMMGLIKIAGAGRKEATAELAWDIYMKNTPETELGLEAARAMVSIGDACVPFIDVSLNLRPHEMLHRVLAAIGTENAFNVLLSEHARYFGQGGKTISIEEAIKSMGAKALPYAIDRFEQTTEDNGSICAVLKYLGSSDATPAEKAAIIPRIVAVIERTSDANSIKNTLTALASFPKPAFQTAFAEDPHLKEVLLGFADRYFSDSTEVDSHTFPNLLAAIISDEDIPSLIAIYDAETTTDGQKCGLLRAFYDTRNSGAILRAISAFSSPNEVLVTASRGMLFNAADSGALVECLENDPSQEEGFLHALKEDIMTARTRMTEMRAVGASLDSYRMDLDFHIAVLMGTKKSIDLLIGIFGELDQNHLGVMVQILRALMRGKEKTDSILSQEPDTFSAINTKVESVVLTPAGTIEGQKELDALLTTYRDWLVFEEQARGERPQTAPLIQPLLQREKDADAMVALRSYVLGHLYASDEGLWGFVEEQMPYASDVARANIRTGLLKYLQDREKVSAVRLGFGILPSGVSPKDGVRVGGTEIPSFIFTDTDTESKVAIDYFKRRLGFIPKSARFVFLPDTIHIVLDAESYMRMEYRERKKIEAGKPDDFYTLSNAQKETFTETRGFFGSNETEPIAGFPPTGIITFGKGDIDGVGNLSQEAMVTLWHEWQHAFFEKIGSYKILETASKASDALIELAGSLEAEFDYRKIDDLRGKVITEVVNIILSKYQNEVLAKTVAGDWDEVTEWWLDYYGEKYSSGINRHLAGIKSAQLIEDIKDEAFLRAKNIIKEHSGTILRIIRARSRIIELSAGLDPQVAQEQASFWTGNFLHTLHMGRFGGLRIYARMLERRAQALEQKQGEEIVQPFSMADRAHLRELQTVYETARNSRQVQQGREVIVPREYLDELSPGIRGTSPDIKIVSLAKAQELAGTTEGAEGRIVILKEEDVSEAVRGSVVCRVLSLEKYNPLHLAAAIELSRSVLASHIESIDQFYQLLMNEALSDEMLENLMNPTAHIINLSLPPVTVPTDQLDDLKKEYAAFIGQA
ncbi:MAG: hypothetical protein COS99_03760 [Candidatus Omnitrophica bacterium CG07_land_8_20_14_0_80_42_15]|uniref:Uncharacterized protein n=1 Tax=Candidatus Aquitaenariimonas noxiae TaxID=1974741 RepID=A0A2J0L3A3_9BACT|nr:MAG: hypothetical protein COS99_03760 [Candidatus Omnitrophica bacterium CG07_land_8_20_14_0_80_42_15]